MGQSIETILLLYYLHLEDIMKYWENKWDDVPIVEFRNPYLSVIKGTMINLINIIIKEL